jgi:hypothetical protein
MSAADVGLSRRGLPLKPPALAKPVGLTEPVLEVSVWDPQWPEERFVLTVGRGESKEHVLVVGGFGGTRLHVGRGWAFSNARPHSAGARCSFDAWLSTRRR